MTSRKLTQKDKLICTFSRPAGFKAVYQYCEDIQEGKTPEPEFLEKLASAFQSMIREDNLADGMAIFTKALDLQAKGGRKVSSAEEVTRIIAALNYRRTKVQHKESYAADTVANDIGVAPSTIRKWSKDYAEEIAELESSIKIWETNWKNRNTKMK